MWVDSHMPPHACGGQRTVLRSRFSHSGCKACTSDFFTEGAISLAIFDVCEQLLLISLHQVQSEMSVERMLEPGSGNLVLVRVREFC